MKRVIIIQARMTSTRLPGKVMMNVGGKPMLAQQLQRLRQCQCVDEIVIATTRNTSDEPLVELARKEGLGWFRGSEDDVLSRYVGAARQFQADVVVRVTADCPLIDPLVTDRVIEDLVDHRSECDYASNVLKRTYPRGLDTEAMFLDTLFRIDRLAQSKVSREHVTIMARSERRDLFVCRSIEDDQNNADLRWVVDTMPDLEVVRALYDGLDLGVNVESFSKIVAYARKHPELVRLNSGMETWDPMASAV